MQQQLNELEDRERIGGGVVVVVYCRRLLSKLLGGGEGGGDPKPPPRGRANPFNNGGEVVLEMLCMICCKLF